MQYAQVWSNSPPLPTCINLRESDLQTLSTCINLRESHLQTLWWWLHKGPAPSQMEGLTEAVRTEGLCWT